MNLMKKIERRALSFLRQSFNFRPMLADFFYALKPLVDVVALIFFGGAGILNKILKTASIMGCMVMGVLIVNYFNVHCGLTEYLAFNGDACNLQLNGLSSLDEHKSHLRNRGGWHYRRILRHTRFTQKKFEAIKEERSRLLFLPIRRLKNGLPKNKKLRARYGRHDLSWQ